MEKKLDLVEILKNCPKGTKLYSSIHGEIELLKVNNTDRYPIMIVVNANNNTIDYFTKEGLLYDYYENGECILFPSKENRDWSTFEVKKEHQFKVGDEVLVRDSENSDWKYSIYSHYDNRTKCHRTVGLMYKQCISFVGNEHLLGTNLNIPLD